MESLRIEQTSLMLQKTWGCSTTFCCWNDSPAPAYSYFIFNIVLQYNQTIRLIHLPRRCFTCTFITIVNYFYQQSQRVTMLVALLVGFQLIAIIFLGSFARTDTSSTAISYHPLYANCALLCLAFALIYAPLRKLSLYSLASVLLVIAVTVQTYLLFGTFWDSCFNGFQSTFTVDLSLIVRSLFASLTVLLTVLDFLGLFCYWQVYLIMAPVMTIGSSLSGSILIRGLKIFDGGGGLAIFLYSGVCSFVIWALLIREKLPAYMLTKRKSYFNHTLGLIGVILLFINWPKFNSAGAFLSYINVDTTSISIGLLQNSAIANTFLALSVSILVACILSQKASEVDKLQYSTFAECIINGGISVASFQDVCLDPIAVLLIAGSSSFLTLFIKKKVKATSISNELVSAYGSIVFRLLFPLIGTIVCSMVVGGRSSRSPNLLSDSYSKTAGLEIVGLIIVICIALIFGAITAVLIRIFLTSKAEPAPSKERAGKMATDTGIGQYVNPKDLQLSDSSYFVDISEQACPLYYDMFEGIKDREKEKYDFAQENDRLKQAMVSSNPLKLMLLNKNVSTNQPPKPKQGPSQQLIISRNFTRDNPQKDVQNSEMKYQYPENDQPLDQEHSICEPVNSHTQKAAEFKEEHVQEEMQGSKRLTRSSKVHIQILNEANATEQPRPKPRPQVAEHQQIERSVDFSRILPSNFDSTSQPILIEKDELEMVHIGDNLLVSRASRENPGTGPLGSKKNIRMTGSRVS